MDENLNRRNGCLIFLWILVAFLAGFSIALRWNPHKLSRSGSEQLGKMSEVMNYIEQFYVDSVDVDSIYGLAINAMLQGLDPHSTYSTAEENKTMMETLEGSFEGIGIQFNIMNDTLMVVSVISGGPSEKAGLMAGDRMIEVDGKSIIGIKNDQAFKLLRGKKGSKVKVGILRPGFKEKYTYEITRGVIPTYTVDVAYMMDAHTGYIKLNEFGSTTAKEFSNAIQKLKKQGMTSLIVDLRANTGGFLDAAISVCDEFLPKNRKIVSIEGSKVRPEVIYATNKGDFENGKVVILIDDFSASASEIVAGAIQDNDRGIIVGRRSFGKGLVQRQFDLSDKSSIRLTTSRYHTPSGRCIQRDYNDGTEAYYEDLYNRLISGEMESVDSIHLDSTKVYHTLKGRTVYGGGGIMPDYFVPLERNDDKDAYYEISNTSALIQFAFHYANSHKAELQKRYPDAKSYVADMAVTDQMLQQLVQYYEKNNKKKLSKMSANSSKELKVWLKALIGRNLYGDEAFYPVINKTDNVIQKALEVLPLYDH
jgi:carboxyl-terminal processing protease